MSDQTACAPRPLRILYHHRTRGEDAQGIHIRALCDAWREDGHEVRVVAPRVGNSARRGSGARPRQAAPAPDARPTLFGFAVPYWLYELLALGYNVPAFLRLLLAVLRTRPDFLYERYALFNVAGVAVARLTGTPIILEVNAPLSLELRTHGDLTFRRLAEVIERSLCRSATRTLVVSEAMAEVLVGLGVPRAQLEVMPNGVDSRRFHPGVQPGDIRARHGIPESAPVVGFVGWIRPWHGVDRLIDAVAALREEQPDLALLVVGDGPAVPALQRQVEALGLGQAVHFTGPVPAENVPQHIAAVDIAVQPDVTGYASPIKLFEYLALGRAVVAPDRPNIREVVTDGANAALFKAEDTASLTEALRGLVTDRDRRRRLAASAAALINERGYTWRRNARRVIELAMDDSAPALSARRS